MQRSFFDRPVRIPTEQALAMKAADLSLPWNKLRVISSHVGVLMMCMDSQVDERPERDVCECEAAGTGITAEKGAFTFTVDNQQEIREVPFVYCPNLIAKVADTVTHHER